VDELTPDTKGSIAVKIRGITPLLMLALTTAVPALAQEPLAELERKVEALTEEIEALKLGAAGDTSSRVARVGRFGLAPAASKVYQGGRGVSIGGYGEALYENFDHDREDGAPSGRLDRLDYLRQVFYLGYKFTDDLLFNSEIELEHAGVHDEAGVEGQADPVTGVVEGTAELSGEVSLEFAYLDWALHRALGVRAGLLLLPLGMVNELHEPPIYLGARRPEVERRIIPTTWRANGVGIYGEVAGAVSYRAYVTEGLDARGFSAAGGIRGGRQSGSSSLATRAAASARVDFDGVPGLMLGSAAYTGDSWQDFQPAGLDLRPRVTLLDLHARYQWRGLELRGLYARGSLDDAPELSDALGLSGSNRLGASFFGAYLEGAYDVWPHVAPGSRFALAPYARIERFDTQDDVTGAAEDPANRRRVVIAGLAFKPHPQVVVKSDREWRRNDAGTETSQWNAALGYLF